jgi:hypothetical protein
MRLVVQAADHTILLERFRPWPKMRGRPIFLTNKPMTRPPHRVIGTTTTGTTPVRPLTGERGQTPMALSGSTGRTPDHG